MGVVFVATAAAATTVTALVRTVAPGSTLSGPAATATLDTHTAHFLLIVAVVALSLAVLLVVPVFLVGFRRQVREMGQLAALGASPRHLVTVVLASATLVGGAGGAVGGLVGLAAGAALTPAPGAPSVAQIALPIVSVIAVVVTVVGLCATCAAYPALLAARLDVMAALRDQRAGAGRRAAWTSRPASLLAVGVLVSGPPAVALLRTGSTDDGWAPLVSGVLAGTVALSALAALVAVLMIRLPIPQPLSARYAFRDSARHLLQVVPGASAGAAIVAALVSAVVFAGTTSAGEAGAHVPVAPDGGVFVQAVPDDARAAVATIAGVDLEAPVEVVAESQAWAVLPPGGGPPHPLDGRPTALNAGGALIASDQFEDLFDLPDATTAVLADGRAAARASLSAHVSDGVLQVQTPQGALAIDVAATLPESAPAALILPRVLVDELGLNGEVVGMVFTTGRHLAAADEEAISAALTDGWATVETGSPAVSAAPTQYLLTAAAGLLTFLVVMLLTTLTREESAADGRTLEAVGANPWFVRHAAAVKAFLQSGVATACGVPAGVGLGVVLLHVRAVSVPSAVTVPVIPWVALSVAALALPPLVAVAAAGTSWRPVNLARRVV